MDKVSIIIPVFNNVAYVEKCIRSVTTQTYRELEIIVVDDGSSDGSTEILKRFAEDDPRILLLRQENSGVSAARNRGLELASGRYLTFVDGDDYISRDYVEKLVHCARRHDAEMVICGLNYVDEHGKILRTLIPGEYVRFKKEEWTFRISAVCSHLYERRLWDDHGIRFQPGERGEDMPISLFFSAVCAKIATLSAAGYFYVQHSSSAMHNFRGLRNYRLPYQSLEAMIRKVQKTGIVNSPEFHELFVLRILATCYFNLARGASREEMHRLCNYIVRLLKTYFPDFRKNPLIRLFTQMDVPFAQKAAVRLLVFLSASRLLYPFSLLLSRGRG